MIDFAIPWAGFHARPAWEVAHATLVRLGHSPYKSECPACHIGLLLVHRHPETLELQEFDRCTHCLQTFRYTDIATLRAREQEAA